MLLNNLRNRPATDFDEEDQLTLPFADYLPPPPRPPITHRQIMEFGGDRKRAYELIVHLDPWTQCVLAYRLHQITKH